MVSRSLITGVRFVIIGILVLALGAFSGWFYYLHMQNAANARIDQGRGLDTATPSFGGSGGSTYGNIIADAVSKVAGFAQQDTTAASPAGKLWHVDQAPVAGMGFVTTGSSTVLSYAQQATGYLFSANTATRSLVRTSNILLPKTYTAQFAYDGSYVLQTIDENGAIRTVAGPLSSTANSSTSAPVLGRDLPKNLRSLSFNPKTRTLFWIASDPKGGVFGASVPWGSSTGTRLFSSIIGGWHPLSMTDGRLYITERAADDMPGYAFEVSKTGTLAPVIRQVPGLTFLPGDSVGTFLYSSSAGGVVSLYVKTTASSSPLLLPLHTITDKCVWLPGASAEVFCAVPMQLPAGDFLGPWYRGTAHTSDVWWHIDARTGTTERMYSPKDTDGLSLDVVHPVIDVSGNFIAFINGSDQSLWLLRVH